MCVQLFSPVWLSAAPLTVAHQAGPSIHGIFQAIMMEQISMFSLRGSSSEERILRWVTSVRLNNCLGSHSFLMIEIRSRSPDGAVLFESEKMDF